MKIHLKIPSRAVHVQRPLYAPAQSSVVPNYSIALLLILHRFNAGESHLRRFKTALILPAAAPKQFLVALR